MKPEEQKKPDPTNQKFLEEFHLHMNYDILNAEMQNLFSYCDKWESRFAAMERKVKNVKSYKTIDAQHHQNWRTKNGNHIKILLEKVQSMEKDIDVIYKALEELKQST